MERRRKKSVIKNNANVALFVCKGEMNSGKVISVPNESYSIRELYERRVRNQPLPEIARPAYFGGSHESMDFEEVRRMDLVDQEEAGKVLDDVVARGKKRADAVRAKREKDAAEKAAREKAKDDFFAESMRNKNVATGKGGTNDDNRKE